MCLRWRMRGRWSSKQAESWTHCSAPHTRGLSAPPQVRVRHCTAVSLPTMPCSVQHTLPYRLPATFSTLPSPCSSSHARACPSAPLPLCAAVSSLEPHTLYALRVRALNSVGSSTRELERFRTAPAPPSAPQALELQHATPSRLALAWAPPRSDHGAPVTGYQLECARGGRGSGGAGAGGWRLAYQGADLHAQVSSQGGCRGAVVLR